MRETYWIVAIVCLSIVAMLFWLGEYIVYAGFLALGILGWRSPKWTTRLGALFAAIVGLVFHVKGFKVYGAPAYAVTPALPGAAQVTVLEPPSTIRFADGRSVNLDRVYFPKTVRLDTHDENNFWLWDGLGKQSKDAKVNIRMTSDGRRAECLRRNLYWCGNTFHPTFFPGRLPTHTVVDFAQVLVRAQLALPTTDRESDVLMEAFDRSVRFGTYPLSGIVRHGDKTAVELGNRLATPGSRLFVAGAYLLIAAQEISAYPTLEREVRRRKQRNRDDYDEIAQSRSSDLDDILAWINVDEARRRVAAASIAGQTSSWIGEAEILVSHGDLSPFDLAVRLMNENISLAAAKDLLAQTIPRLFRWPEESRRFQEWYAAMRPQLHAGRDEFGKLAFWLDDGGPFDDRYFTSMSGFADRESLLPK